MSQPGGDIQERIAAARREAEVLKEKIRASREASADTSCMLFCRSWQFILFGPLGNMLYSTRYGC
jgi:hypothetical protein